MKRYADCGKESQDPFDFFASVKFTPEYKPAIGNERSDFESFRRRTSYREESWKRDRINGDTSKVNGDGDGKQQIKQDSKCEINSTFTKYYADKFIAMTTTFGKLEKKIAEVEMKLSDNMGNNSISGQDLVDKMEKLFSARLEIIEDKVESAVAKMEKSLISGQDIENGRNEAVVAKLDELLISGEETINKILKLETSMTQKIVETIDGKLKKIYESLYKGQKKCIEIQNQNNFDVKLKHFEESTTILLEKINAEIHNFKLPQRNPEPDRRFSQDNFKVPCPVPQQRYSLLPSPAVSAKDVIAACSFKRPLPVGGRKRPDPMQMFLRSAPY